MPAWWEDALIYQIYPLSFQDSDGDGYGDLRGIASRLEHVASLGAAAIWLSPIYPSPLADNGYDISDFTDVDRRFGSLADLDALVERAHALDLKVLLDLVPSHTSIEHPWFREHPEWYIWADSDGPPNNWLAAFGGPAWSRDEVSGRWYLHSFYPEQPDLNWRNPEVVAAMTGVIRFWLARGVDGFRVDALDRVWKDPALRDDPPGDEDSPFPVAPEEVGRLRIHSRAAEGFEEPLAALRVAAGEALLVGEVYRPMEEFPAYLRHLDMLFAFEFAFAAWDDAATLGALIEETVAFERVAWVLSNHDFDRAVTRLGPELARAASVVMLTLPGPAFVYQGEEIGLANGEGGPTHDRAGRDGARRPMQWDATAGGGFTTGEPWLPLVDPAARNVVDEARDPGSVLALFRALGQLRRHLEGPFELLQAEGSALVFRRGGHVVAANLGERPVPLTVAGEVVLSTHASAERGTLAPFEARVLAV